MADGDQKPAAPASLAQGTGKVYAYEAPALAPGAYNIEVTQKVSADGQPAGEDLTTTQPFHVQATDPYVLPPSLVHSIYPPRMRSVTATTLPHIMLAGAVPWERRLTDITGAEGTAPYPWLALLVFAPDELVVPPTLADSTTKPSVTKALTITLDAMNKDKANFSLHDAFPSDQASTDSAAFIFVKGKTFRYYFERQQGQPAQGSLPEQTTADLDRYKYLTYMTDTGQVSGAAPLSNAATGAGPPTDKYATIMGHRSRPYSMGKEPQTAIAHLVSLEGLVSRVDWKATAADGALVALVSLYSWTYTWEPNGSDASIQLFEGLKEHVRPLSIRLPAKADNEKVSDAREWMRGRLDEGYTIVRHRDLAGETTMALYRGPLCPKQTRRIQIKPSMYGTDLQIIDMAAKILDVSYSIAWDLGRSLAGRDIKFSTAIAALRRQLVLKATTGARASDGVTSSIDDLVNSVLGTLNDLFSGPLDQHLQGMPAKGTKRWQGAAPSIVPTAAAPGVMTQAKLRRNLAGCTRPWLLNAVTQLCQPKKPESGGAAVLCDAPLFAEVATWVLDNLMSLRLVPALNLFADPTVLGDEEILTFLVDDTWVDAMVDGALSVGNAVGGIEDPVRDEIRVAMNAYILNAPSGVVAIPSGGFIVRSSLVESFPDIEITATLDKDSSGGGGGQPIPIVYRARHDDMIICFCARGPTQALSNFSVSMKLPAHQQRFVLQPVTAESLTLTIRLDPLIDPAVSTKPPGDPEAVTWSKAGPAVSPPDMPVKVWDWDTGIMIPHVVADVTVKVAEKKLLMAFKPLGPDSGALYVAMQLADRQHSLVVPFKVDAITTAHARQLFPLLEEVTEATGPTSAAQSYDPPATGSARHSSLTKKAFSVLFPDKNIPVQSAPPQTIVFVVKPTQTAAIAATQPTTDMVTSVTAIDFILPIGRGAHDLLDADAPDPIPRPTDKRLQWIAAAYRRFESELVVQLRPRVPGGRGVPLAGLDASFVLTRATVNGILGDQVKIEFHETYVEEESKAARKSTEKAVSNTYTVSGSWSLSKE
ncbi:hypothetical protein B0T25DRAFT_471031 [Lasiosphaeria hispida]|uniref:Uncharacterized protein n=1 Tax=Lasiosphaeria hispida TaxID=260671 RepID=A0AAJ0HY45_9PEZI|nr:hypothetical protein B0T25DRAFT_471031 [Lasiosphaeria hispida]